MILAASLSIQSGCSRLVEPTYPVVEEALFCTVMAERFRYRQEEIDLRTNAGYTKNLAREYRLNLSWDRECADLG